MKIISTKLFAQLQILLREKIRTCEPHEMDHFIALLNESNDEDHVAEVKREVFDHFSHNGSLLSAFMIEQRWFDVDHILPHKHKPVLAIASSRYGGTRAIFQAVYTNNGWLSQSDYDGAGENLIVDDTTTHWACLPLFPKLDDSDDQDDSDDAEETVKDE